MNRFSIASQLLRLARQIAERDVTRRAGLFEPPPKMTQDIISWVLAIIAYRSSLRLTNRIWDYEGADWSNVDFNNIRTIPDKVSVGDWDDLKEIGPQKFIEKMKKRKDELKAIVSASPKPVELVAKKKEVSFKVDLTGWKYLPRVEAAGKDALKKALTYFRSIKVTLLMSDEMSHRVAAWYGIQHRLELIVDPIFDVDDVEDELKRNIVHEMRHFSQDFLARIVGADKTGFPSRRVQNPEIQQSYAREDLPSSSRTKEVVDRLEKQGITKDMFHDLDDVEFYTVIGDAIDEIKRNIDVTEENKKEAVFRSMMGIGAPLRGAYPPHFVRLLKKNSPDKWRKAVTEIYKALRP